MPTSVSSKHGRSLSGLSRKSASTSSAFSSCSEHVSVAEEKENEEDTAESSLAHSSEEHEDAVDDEHGTDTKRDSSIDV